MLGSFLSFFKFAHSWVESWVLSPSFVLEGLAVGYPAQWELNWTKRWHFSMKNKQQQCSRLDKDYKLEHQNIWELWSGTGNAVLMHETEGKPTASPQPRASEHAVSSWDLSAGHSANSPWGKINGQGSLLSIICLMACLRWNNFRVRERETGQRGRGKEALARSWQSWKKPWHVSVPVPLFPFIYCHITNHHQNAEASNNSLFPFLMFLGSAGKHFLWVSPVMAFRW